MTTPTLPKPAERTYLERVQERLEERPNARQRAILDILWDVEDFALSFDPDCQQANDFGPWCECTLTASEAHRAESLRRALDKVIRANPCHRGMAYEMADLLCTALRAHDLLGDYPKAAIRADVRETTEELRRVLS